jgi:hypothetical protein
MGLSESVIKSLTGPCEKCSHECNKYFLDDLELDSNCSKCCEFHMRSHAHKTDKDDDFESAESENAEHD